MPADRFIEAPHEQVAAEVSAAHSTSPQEQPGGESADAMAPKAAGAL